MFAKALTMSALLIGIGTASLPPAQAEEEAGKGNLRYTITVSKFENKAGWHGQWDIGDAWGTVLTDQLQQSKKFVVLGETDMRQEAMAEQDLATTGRMAGGKKAPKTGQMTPAQLLVKGAITHVQDSTVGGGGGLNFKGISIGGNKDTAEINVTIYIVDSTTGQVKASKNVVGKAGRKGLRLGYSGSSLGGLTGDMGGFMKDNVGKATADAVNQAVEFLTKQLDTIPWEGSVVAVKGDKVTINRGSREGVAEGLMLDVGQTEEVRDPDTGELLDSDMTKVATVKVTSVKEKICYAEPQDGAKKIEKGMAVQPAQ
jgi:curli biogenesis system outer membrane secretion channel CsgG